MTDFRQWEVPAEAIAFAFDKAEKLKQKKDRGRKYFNTKHGWFLRGPIPMPWILEAKKLGFGAYHTGMMLWQLHGVVNKGVATAANWKPVRFPNIQAERFGIDRHAKSRALKALEEAGLISVDRSIHASPLVTMCEVPAVTT